MFTWIIYDIKDGKTRLHIVRKCKQIGLIRVQKSVFLGRTTKPLLKNFRREIAPIIDPDSDVLFIVPMTGDEFSRMTQMGRSLNLGKINRKGMVIFI